MTATAGPDGSDDLLLPAGTRLIHIGPPKTGTTYLQGAFHGNREAVSAQGVHYAGPTRQPVAAVQAIVGNASPSTGKVPSMRWWRHLVGEVRRAREPRVVISSEFLSEAKPDTIRTIVEDLGGERVHIVVTLRPLSRILSSQWQQFVQSGERRPFDDWLDAVFNDPSRLKPVFWRRHRHDQLVARWTEVVGPDNVTVVALDDQDHDMVLRVFEQLLGLRVGTLAAEDDVSNRSMTLPEIEIVRAFNAQFFDAGLSRPLHTTVMRFGAASYVKSHPAATGEPRLETPRWALERAGAVGREMVDAIVASGVRIVGDHENLTRLPPASTSGAAAAELHISPRTAAATAMGVVVASGLARTSTSSGSSASRVPGEPAELVGIPTIQVAVVLWVRIRTAIGRRAHGLRRRLTRLGRRRDRS